MLDSTTKTTTAKSASPQTGLYQAFRAVAEKGIAQAKECSRRSAPRRLKPYLIKNSFSTAVKGAQDYNAKIIEFVQTNTKATVDFVQDCGCEIAFRVLSNRRTDQSRRESESCPADHVTLRHRPKKVTLANVEPLRPASPRHSASPLEPTRTKLQRSSQPGQMPGLLAEGRWL